MDVLHVVMGINTRNKGGPQNPTARAFRGVVAMGALNQAQMPLKFGDVQCMAQSMTCASWEMGPSVGFFGRNLAKAA